MSSPQHEPTMEEILASIRKIISEDNPEPAPAAAAVAPSPAPAPEPAKPDLEVLELTQEVVEPAARPAPEAEPQAQAPAQPEPPPQPSPPPQETKADEIVFEPIGAREPKVPPANDGIFSDQTRKALEDTFAAIPDEPEERPRETPARAPDGASVESVFERAVKESFAPVLEQYLADNTGQVIERLTPLIRQWMDENFPPLLENAVKSEMERIIKARTRR